MKKCLEPSQEALRRAEFYLEIVHAIHLKTQLPLKIEQQRLKMQQNKYSEHLRSIYPQGKIGDMLRTLAQAG